MLVKEATGANSFCGEYYIFVMLQLQYISVFDLADVFVEFSQNFFDAFQNVWDVFFIMRFKLVN